MTRRTANIVASITCLMLCVLSPVLARPRHEGYRRNFVMRRTPKFIPRRFMRCEDRAIANRYNPAPPDFTVQYGCIEHPEMMGGSLGAMLRGENPAAGALP
jgi:hypothetical protein